MKVIAAQGIFWVPTTIALSIVTLVMIVLPRMTAVASENNAPAAHVSIAWVDRYAQRFSRDDTGVPRTQIHEDIDWITRLDVGVAVGHDQRTLDRLLNKDIAAGISVSPNRALEMERIADGGPLPVALAPPYWELFGMLPGTGFPRLEQVHEYTIRDDDRWPWSTFGTCGLLVAQNLPPGLYRLRFTGAGMREGLLTDSQWHYFELKEEEPPEGSHPRDRLPWRNLLEE